jgi:uncharacterized protein
MQHTLSKYLLFQAVEEHTLLFSSRVGEMIVLPHNTWTNLQAGAFDALTAEEHQLCLDKKVLLPQNEKELDIVLAENQEAIAKDSSLYYAIQPTAMCQLGCHYCGQKHTNDYLSNTQEMQIVQYLQKELQTGKYTALSIAWFGAEPLLGYEQILRLSAQFKDMALAHQVPYSAKIVTNGLQLTAEKYKTLLDLDCTFFEVTLDGTAEHHDKRRYKKSQKGSFDEIFKNVLAIANSPDYKDYSLSIRCNVDEQNHAGVLDLLHLLAENNLQQKVSFYTSPIHAWGNDAHKQSLSLSDYANFEIDIILAMCELGFSVNPLPVRKKNLCMATAKNSGLIDAFGNIYNCTEIPYVPTYEHEKYIIGTLEKGETGIARPFENWNAEILAGKSQSPCANCAILPVCGGACPKAWHEGIFSCPAMKQNLQERMAITYLQMQGQFKEVENMVHEY